MVVERVIAHINERTAYGLDGIPAKVVKHLGSDSRQQIANISSEVLASDDIISEWLRRKVTFIDKRDGDLGLAQDYRPVTVTCVLYRVFPQILIACMGA